jgi:hypothetical protein
MNETGRTFRLSPQRRLICDMLHFAQKIPTVPVQRCMDVSAVRDARAMLGNPPSWVMLFTKAYAIVAQEMPELRRAYLGFGRLYEHPHNIGVVALEREYCGENGVFFIHLRGPDRQPLLQLQGHLRRAKDEPVESISLFRRALLISRYPLPLRRFFWRMALHWSGKKRAKWLGTFGVSVYSGLGAESLHPLGVLTTTLTYGPIDADGAVNVRIVYDHRTLDGATVARALGRLEQVLNQQIVMELRELARPESRALAG